MDAYDRQHSLDRTQAGHTVASQPRKPKRSEALTGPHRHAVDGCTESIERVELGLFHLRGPGYAKETFAKKDA